ncbi:uncharacterized protein LOC143803793 [Ranitomeya variabilis]|uniref:uncharacterized protein LOC143803793 n=1 Tax=Ranitomeya variabilis TaxID=490064 RepID=UPI004056D4E2
MPTTTEEKKHCWCLPQHCNPTMPNYNHYKCRLILCDCPHITTTQHPTTLTLPPATAQRPTTKITPTTTEGNDQCWCLPQNCSPEMYYRNLCPLMPCECPSLTTSKSSSTTPHLTAVPDTSLTPTAASTT